MFYIRKIFYLLLGMTFPFFWALHYSGFMGYLYAPFMLLAGDKDVIWPSFITAGLLYFLATLFFEWLYRRLYNIEDTSREFIIDFPPENPESDKSGCRQPGDE